VRRKLALLPAVVLTACAPDAAVRVTIPAGASMRAAAESLASAGVVRWPRLFSAYAASRNWDRGIKAGTYVLAKRATWHALLATLRGGGAATTVVVPEGLTVAQIEALVVRRLDAPPDSAAAATRDTAILRRLGVPAAAAASLEGYLFPDTYFFPPGTSARTAVTTMARRFEQQWRPEWSARLDTLRMTRHDVVTLASIVEREARVADERPLIAAVYHNRLRRGMRLQADPTVQYALPQHQQRLLNRHLAVESPYNTYRRRGLPPGPIAAPGAASIQAALYPANVAYLYFVAFPDGHHEFRAQLSDHQTVVRQARRAWSVWRRSQTPATSRTPTASRRGG
jgi:UPF0755 protein